jgi:hypothetical protein
MKMKIETLNEAMELGLKITATYYPTGEYVVCWNNEDLREIKRQDGTFERVHINDLINFRWE